MSWAALSEDLLRGLVHGMNNRITALSAFVELASMDRAALELDPLRQEITKVHALSTLIGVLATRIDEMEALELHAVLDVAMRIHAHQPRMRNLPCSVESSGLVLPVRVPRWALTRVLMFMIDAAKEAGDLAQDSAVVVRLSGDDAVVRAQVDSTEPLDEDAALFAEACGATLTASAGKHLLVLPSLLELRRRERSASA